MNRAQKTYEYLLGQSSRLIGAEALRDDKQAFFNTIQHLRNEIIPSLRESKLVSVDDIDSLDSTMTGIDRHRTKSGGTPNKVYWNGVRPDFYACVEKINDIVTKLSLTRVPIRIKITDFVKCHWLAVATLLVCVITLFLAC